jgi:3-hydroxybutyryl-CoA dehydrogenase
MVKRGEFGMKSGKGFHVWTDKSASKIRERVSKHLQKLEEILKNP